MRVRLDVSYDGTDFSGWAVQPQRRTVAGVLTDALHRLYGAARVDGLTVAGRTDAGVHATGQVCHVDLDLPEVPANALHRLARILPGDVRVTRVTAVPDSFDARFSATYRRYAYRVTDAPYGAAPLRRRDTLAWPRPLDLARLGAAASALVGEHDFAAYCRRKENATTIRALTRLSWRREPDGVLAATVQADAFCQAMVRSLVGALLAVGDGRRDVAWPAALLARRERAGEVTVAPAHGLTLVAVGYPDDPAGYAAQDARTRRLRTPPTPVAAAGASGDGVTDDAQAGPHGAPADGVTAGSDAAGGLTAPADAAYAGGLTAGSDVARAGGSTCGPDGPPSGPARAAGGAADADRVGGQRS